MTIFRNLWVSSALALANGLCLCTGRTQPEQPYDSQEAIHSNIEKLLAQDSPSRRKMEGCEPDVLADLSRQQPGDAGLVIPPLFEPLPTTKAAYKVCIVSHYMPNIAYYAAETVENHKNYARTHGYLYQAHQGLIAGGRFLFPEYPLDDPLFRYGIYWQSLAALEHAMARKLPHSQQPLCERVMWVDADALFTRFDSSVEQTLDRWNAKHSDIVLNREMCSQTVNAGIMVLKNSAASRDFLGQIMGMFPRYRHDRTPEQMAMTDLVLSEENRRAGVNASLSANVTVLPQRAMNSLAGREHRQFFRLAEDPDGFWHEGDFMGHFYGPKHPQKFRGRVQWMRDMAARNWYFQAREAR